MSLLTAVAIPVLRGSCLEFYRSPRRPDALMVPYALDPVTVATALITVEELELEQELILTGQLCQVPAPQLKAVGLHLARLNATSHHVKWGLSTERQVVAQVELDFSPGGNCQTIFAYGLSWLLSEVEDEWSGIVRLATGRADAAAAPRLPHLVLVAQEDFTDGDGSA